uniref:Uncharacterized protein n=1 Tax=Arundo donax TaxID=35708 RepID=A0A0A9C5R1_ARUDO
MNLRRWRLVTVRLKTLVDNRKLGDRLFS